VARHEGKDCHVEALSGKGGNTMQPELEDLFFGPGPMRVVNQERQFRWEDSQRRVRVNFAGLTIADSTAVMRLQEYGRLPVYYFPLQDVRQEVLEATDHHTHSPLKGGLDPRKWRR